MFAKQQQGERFLRAVDVFRLVRGGPETGGHLLNRHHLHHLGGGDGTASRQSATTRPRQSQNATHRTRKRSLRYRLFLSSRTESHFCISSYLSDDSPNYYEMQFDTKILKTRQKFLLDHYKFKCRYKKYHIFTELLSVAFSRNFL